MEKREAKRLSKILPNVVGTVFGTDCQLRILESRAIEFWPEVIGSVAAAYTSDLKFVNGTLIVKVSSPILRHELFMQCAVLVEKLNKKVGEKVVLKILFR